MSFDVLVEPDLHALLARLRQTPFLSVHRVSQKFREWSPYDTGEIVRIKVAELI
jgi:hypothetical protein